MVSHSLHPVCLEGSGSVGLCSVWCPAPGRHSASIGGWAGGFSSSDISQVLCCRLSAGHHSSGNPDRHGSCPGGGSDGDVWEQVGNLRWCSGERPSWEKEAYMWSLKPREGGEGHEGTGAEAGPVEEGCHAGGPGREVGEQPGAQPL